MPQMGMTTIGQYLNEIGQYKLLTSEEMKELFIKYNEGDESAKELLINSNLRNRERCDKFGLSALKGGRTFKW